MKTAYRILANLFFLAHIIIVFLILFGFLFQPIYAIYLLLLISTLLSELLLGYCPMTKLEFDMRRKIESGLTYDYSFFSYHPERFN